MLLTPFPRQPHTFYGGCRSCVSPTCCTKNAKNGIVEPPFITSFDTRSLPEVVESESVTVHRTNAHTGRVNVYLKPGDNGGCPFYKSGSCAVYARRPVDCRLFPLDLRFRDGEYLLLLYDFPGCEGRIHLQAIDDVVAYFEALAPLLGADILDYATAAVPGMDQMLSQSVVATYSSEQIAALVQPPSLQSPSNG